MRTLNHPILSRTVPALLCALLTLFSPLSHATTTLAAPAKAPLTTPTKTPLITPNKKPLLLSAKTPRITIVLPATPSTGYHWFLADYDAKLLTVVDYHYRPALSQLVGAAGQQVWSFALTKNAGTRSPQVTHINFISARPWTLINQHNTRYTVFITP